jgi:nucleotide-binding universal stress UspA family protein
VPHERIAQAARSKKADLVVIGTHGRTGFAKLFLGSVASRVLTIAPCPVLTVRGK